MNFSVSHGISGPLYILSKLVNKDILQGKKRKDALVAINVFAKDILMHTFDEDYISFPGVLPIELYNRIKDNSNRRLSWCYGNVGVINSLQAASKVIANAEIDKLVYRAKKQIFEDRNWFLDSPTICHGYSGVICWVLSQLCFENSSTEKKELKYLLNYVIDKVLLFYSDENVFGFQDTNKHEDGTVTSNDNMGILTGSLGILLCMKYAIYDDDRTKNKDIFLQHFLLA